jgi:hypothetical protein
MKAILLDPEPSAALTTLLLDSTNVSLFSVAVPVWDPYLLNGALIEGIAATIMQRIPAEKRGEASLEAMRLLRDQLRSHGAI